MCGISVHGFVIDLRFEIGDFFPGTLVVCNTYSYRLLAAGCESGAAAKAAVSEQKTTFFCEAVLPLKTKF